MTNEIVLPVGCNAEPDTCGSCKFFRRRGTDCGDYNRDMGYCRIVLPPFKERFLVKPVEYDGGGDDLGPNLVKDTHRCDLHRSDGRTYIVQRKVVP